MTHLLNIGNVLVHRFRRNEIFLAKGSFDQSALKMTFGAIAMDAAWRAGKSGPAVALQGFINGESEIAVGAWRDKSRLVVGPECYEPPPRPTPARLPPRVARKHERWAYGRERSGDHPPAARPVNRAAAGG